MKDEERIMALLRGNERRELMIIVTINTEIFIVF
jgi:hypothetical protein